MPPKLRVYKPIPRTQGVPRRNPWRAKCSGCLSINRRESGTRNKRFIALKTSGKTSTQRRPWLSRESNRALISFVSQSTGTQRTSTAERDKVVFYRSTTVVLYRPIQTRVCSLRTSIPLQALCAFFYRGVNRYFESSWLRLPQPRREPLAISVVERQAT